MTQFKNLRDLVDKTQERLIGVESKKGSDDLEVIVTSHQESLLLLQSELSQVVQTVERQAQDKFAIFESDSLNPLKGQVQDIQL